jgi:P27 family predicted phage terminase small subunit
MAGTAASGGRNKKATQDVVRQGTFRTDRHGDHQTPEPPKGIPEPPKPLDGDAREEWDRMVARLEKMGTLSTVDDGALYQSCQLFAETEDLARLQQEAGDTARILRENFDGNEEMTFVDQLAAAQEINKSLKLQAGYVSQVRSGRMGQRQWLVEFGLTPAARSRVKVSAPKEKSKVEQFQLRKVGG